MKNILALSLFLSFLTAQGQERLIYPQARKSDVEDNYFGTVFKDPYRWLEDDNSKETAAWVSEENKVTNAYLEKIPFRNKIKERLTKIWNFEKRLAPFKKGPYYFFYKNDGVQNQNVLYVQDGLRGIPHILIDPNVLSSDGTTSLGEISIRDDGKYIAYNLAKAGSDWNEIHIMIVATGKNLPDTIKWVKFSSASWKGEGFYYSRYPEPKEGKAYSNKNENSKVYYHAINTGQSKDALVYENTAFPNRSYSLGVTDDEQFQMLWGTESTDGNSFSFRGAKETTWKVVDPDFKYDYNVIDNIGNSLLVLTNCHAPKNKLILIDAAKPLEKDWKTIVPEGQELLESASLCGGKIVVKYLKDVSSHLYIYSLEGKQEGEVTLPGLGITSAFNGNKKESIAFYSFSNYITPSSIYKYDFTTGKSDIFFAPKVDFNSSEYESKQVFYTSKDGTKIPMFITYKKGMKMDGNNPCFLYGYGGFNISVTPDFKITIAALLENGFIYAVPNIRGGGEYGEEWHKAGTLCQKQNVFDDFIGAAEYLFREKYTNSSKLAIHGRSNGGLLIGAVMTQRPDLAKVALPGVGVLDMLRYHKFTIGYFWATDYGRSDSLEQFKCLSKYSPLHNLKEAKYPATLITTADHDDRVVPAHSFKFAATLQEKQKGNEPTLIRIDAKAGHGAGKPTTKQIEEWTDIWSFVFWNLGVTPK